MLPILLSIPHGGMRQPPELAGRVCLSQEELFDDSDAYTREIYDLGGEVIRVVSTEIARAFVDVNREPHDRPPANPDGVIKSATCYGHRIYDEGAEPGDELVVELLERYYHPYHRALKQAAKDRRVKLALDCHSMATEAPLIAPDRGRQRPLFCLSNADGLTCPKDLLENIQHAVADAFECELAAVRLNQPFKGGFITRAHGRGKVPWVQVEMNRSLYLDPTWFDRETLVAEPQRLQQLREGFRAALNALGL
ncbi:MAG: N-formylglutamate amidohydrolase [Gemmatimonadetes bacterium]|nr:N-formylglutamate amidohydrolase [Gemmatimonadota bacterium]NIO32722.1 N-formylglutamate amidohydrolase [Gemmatimonadota bacterium]